MITQDSKITIIEPTPREGFVTTDLVQSITRRALTYLTAGFPIHFRGRAGTGKTTLAMHVAHLIGRKVILIHGDEEFTTSTLVGEDYGYRKKRVVDNFIHSVLKTEENVSREWEDNRLTVAVEQGYTLIYDEFTRSRPEANNVLLSILEEKILDLSTGKRGSGYVKVNPDFRAIFTSNPEEYAGTHETQDALWDRMITIDLSDFDRETEVEIIRAKCALNKDEIEKLVSVVRELRNSDACEYIPTVRASIMLARAIEELDVAVDGSNPLLKQCCLDILRSRTARYGLNRPNGRIENIITGLLKKYC